ncbi:hypothetical protein [Microbacterium hibisci]|uniref:hypothetical protein n=1 Tax=Microbacterium hibisci TaxID=2036000 RepID=UPI001940C994|nr:hypothetical protein [Microbacterium hibisci]
MSTPTESPLDELRALRERAYGRDADISDDPAALARLNELEALSAASKAVTTATVQDAEDPTGSGVAAPNTARRPSAVLGAAPAQRRSVAETSPLGSADGRATDAASAAAADLRAGGDSERPAAFPQRSLGADTDPAPPVDRDGLPGAEGLGDEAVEPGASEPAPKRWWHRRIPALWAAVAVAVALALGVGATLGVQSIQAGRVAVLQQDPDGAWPDHIFGPRPDDGRIYEKFHGLTVLVFRQMMSPDDSQTCVYALTDTDGFGAGACGAGPFPAVANMIVGDQAPEELRERFPEGTALQFAVDDEQVIVYAREPGIVQPTP